MPTTANHGWPTPADTGYVKDGAAAIRDLADAIDTELVSAYETLVDRTGASTGDLPTLQGDGTLAFAAAAVGGQVETGTYVGNETATGSAGTVRTVALPFDPTLVIVTVDSSSNYYRLSAPPGTTITTGRGFFAPSSVSQPPAVVPLCVTGGFQVQGNDGWHGANTPLNHDGRTYRYIAIG